VNARKSSGAAGCSITDELVVTAREEHASFEIARVWKEGLWINCHELDQPGNIQLDIWPYSLARSLEFYEDMHDWGCTKVSKLHQVFRDQHLPGEALPHLFGPARVIVTTGQRCEMRKYDGFYSGARRQLANILR
jgi:hypothetical protein